MRTSETLQDIVLIYILAPLTAITQIQRTGRRHKPHKAYLCHLIQPKSAGINFQFLDIHKLLLIPYFAPTP